jgi:non-heme chloroperoxidase
VGLWRIDIVSLDCTAVGFDKLLKNGTLKTYKNYPHGMITTQAAVINADLLSFLQP